MFFGIAQILRKKIRHSTKTLASSCAAEFIHKNPSSMHNLKSVTGLLLAPGVELKTTCFILSET